MDFLPGAAAFAGSEMLLVIVAHFGGKTGNVIAPAGQDFAHDGIDALAHNTTDQLTGGLVAMLLPVPPIKPGYEGVSGGPPGPFRRPLSPLLVVVALGKVRQYDVGCTSIIVLGEEIREGLIGEVPYAAHHPLLDRPGVRSAAQHFKVV